MYSNTNLLATMDSQKKTSLSLEQKLRIIREATDNNKNELCAKYGCCKSTLNRILRNQKHILEKSKTSKLTSKRFRSGACPEVDRAITTWFNQMKASGEMVSSSMVMEKAKEFAVKMKQNFKPSAGWLWRWQKREGINLKKIHRKGNSADVKGADNFCTYILPNLIKNYAPNDIFNANESGLFYKTLPTSLLSQNGRQIVDSNVPKEHLTLLFICNATGDFKKVIVIGKARNPRCFKNKILPLDYHSHERALMTQVLWNEILVALDEEMITQNRKIILFVDNATCHKTTTPLRNVNVQFLPVNTSSIVQPLNQGIIHSFKSYYWQNIIQKRVSAIERGDTEDEFVKSLSILNALHIIKHAWSMVRPRFILNCYVKAKFISDDAYSEEDNKEDVLCSNSMENHLSHHEFEHQVWGDDKLMCRAQATDEDIIEQILPESLPDEYAETHEEDDVMENAPSLQEALISLNTLRNYLLSNNMYASELESIEQYMVSKLFKHKTCKRK